MRIISTLVICLFLISCTQAPVNLRKEVDEIRKDVFGFSKEYSAITLNMAENNRLRALEEMKKKNYSKARQLLVIAKDQYYSAKIETLNVRDKLKDKIYNNLLEADKLRGKIVLLIEEKKMYYYTSFLKAADDYNRTSLNDLKNGNLFFAKQHSANALETYNSLMKLVSGKK